MDEENNINEENLDNIIILNVIYFYVIIITGHSKPICGLCLCLMFYIN